MGCNADIGNMKSSKNLLIPIPARSNLGPSRYPKEIVSGPTRRCEFKHRQYVVCTRNENKNYEAKTISRGGLVEKDIAQHHLVVIN